MRTLEEAILIAVLNEDEAEADRLAAGMLIGELSRFGETLDRVKKLVDRHFWEKKSLPALSPGNAQRR